MLNLWYVNGFCHLTVTEKKGSQTVFTELYHGIVLKVAYVIIEVKISKK